MILTTATTIIKMIIITIIIMIIITKIIIIVIARREISCDTQTSLFRQEYDYLD